MKYILYVGVGKSEVHCVHWNIFHINSNLVKICPLFLVYQIGIMKCVIIASSNWQCDLFFRIWCTHICTIDHRRLTAFWPFQVKAIFSINYAKTTFFYIFTSSWIYRKVFIVSHLNLWKFHFFFLLMKGYWKYRVSPARNLTWCFLFYY